MSAIVFDLGGTYLRGALSDASGKLLAQSIRKKPLAELLQSNRPDTVWDGILAFMVAFEAEVRHQVPPTAPVVLSFPGPIKHPSQILSAPTVAGDATSLPDLASEMRKSLGRPSHIINDISAAAWYFSQMVPAERFLVVTISSGIGSKIFDRAHPLGVLDDIPYAGEIGHALVDPGPQAMTCDCGGRGHLGAVSSGRGVERYARLSAQKEPDRFAQSACAWKFGGTAATLANEAHLVPAARLGDPWALKVIKECTYPLARMLLAVVMAAGLEKVVIIGGFALALKEAYLEVLGETLRESCDFAIMADYLKDLIIMGDLKEEACLEGAAVYARRLGSGGT